ncbi:MAG: L-serine ammonia-lyase, partial [Proteobacteria bacterium]
MSSTSIFDLFKIGIGPSSSHTVGPMVAARTFASGLERDQLLDAVAEVRCELFGSLGATGRGHGSDKAVVLGLMGEDPRTTDTSLADARVAEVRERGELLLLGTKRVPFKDRINLLLHKRRALPYHPNGMRFFAFDRAGDTLVDRCFYSVGGGFVVDEQAVRGDDPLTEERIDLPYPFASADELLVLCREHRLSISAVVLENEKARLPEADIRIRILNIWRVMRECVERGCRTEGVLPGGLKVERRAPALYRSLRNNHKN